MAKAKQFVTQKRPAESASVVVGAIVLLAAKVFGWDTDTTTAVSVILVALAAPVTTFLVEHF